MKIQTVVVTLCLGEKQSVLDKAFGNVNPGINFKISYMLVIFSARKQYLRLKLSLLIRIETKLQD
jgi:hypothetical protein